MEQSNFFSEAALPLIAAAVLVVFGYRARFQHSLRFIRGRKAGPLKDEAKYCEGAGNIMFLLAGFSVLMALAAYFIADEAALGVIIVGVAICFALWYQMNKKYGDV